MYYGNHLHIFCLQKGYLYLAIKTLLKIMQNLSFREKKV